VYHQWSNSHELHQIFQIKRQRHDAWKTVTDDKECLLRELWPPTTTGSLQLKQSPALPACTAVARHTMLISGHRCSSTQKFEGAKDFCSNFPKLARKMFGPLFVRTFSQAYILLGWPPEKTGIHVILQALGAIFFISNHIWRHFCPDFQVFGKGSKDFVQISTNFARIFTKSKNKLLGVRLHHNSYKGRHQTRVLTPFGLSGTLVRNRRESRTHGSWRALSFIALCSPFVDIRRCSFPFGCRFALCF